MLDKIAVDLPSWFAAVLCLQLAACRESHYISPAISHAMPVSIDVGDVYQTKAQFVQYS